MKHKSVLIFLGVIAGVVLVLFGATKLFALATHPSFQTDTVALTSVQDEINATGSVHSASEATLHFQTGGKVVYLPYKIGDTVYQGATIAQLDTYALQRQLTSALNTYKSTRDTFDQTQVNNQNGTLQQQQKKTLDSSANSPVDNTDVINDIVKRVLDQNQATLDNSIINVELANYALQLASLTSPINGVITAEDITVPNVNVTSLTSFSVADPATPLFKAHVAETDIDYVTTGADVLITLNGLTKKLSGTVTQIEPQKIADATGSYYVVDITSEDLKQYGKLGQAGSVLIANTLSGEHLLVPTWTILNHNYIWVLENNQPILKKIVVGKVHGKNVEVLSGLNGDEKIITNPQTIAKNKYNIL